MFISFEGIDGSGKSTQIDRLAADFQAKGQDVLLVREPGGAPLSETIRSLLLDPKADIHPLAEMFLFTAARAQLVHTVIRPALVAGAIVIADRYADSTLAYQGAGRGLSETATLQTIQTCATSGLEPDLTFLLDIAPEDAVLRRSHRGQRADRMEGASLEFYHRVRSCYLELADQAPGRFRVLDARQSEDELASRIRMVIASST